MARSTMYCLLNFLGRASVPRIRPGKDEMATASYTDAQHARVRGATWRTAVRERGRTTGDSATDRAQRDAARIRT